MRVIGILIILFSFYSCKEVDISRTPSSVDNKLKSSQKWKVRLLRKIYFKDSIEKLAENDRENHKDYYLLSKPIVYEFKVLLAGKCFDLSKQMTDRNDKPFGNSEQFEENKLLDCYEISIENVSRHPIGKVASHLHKQHIYIDSKRKIYSVYDFVKHNNIESSFKISRRTMDTLKNSINIHYVTPLNFINAIDSTSDVIYTGNIIDYLKDDYAIKYVGNKLLSNNCQSFSFLNFSSNINIYCNNPVIPDFIENDSYISLVVEEDNE